MKAIIYVIFLNLIPISLFAATVVNADLKAAEACALKDQRDDSFYRLKNFFPLGITSQKESDDKIYRSGCCSWHQGVCGCSDGRTVCCDGELSPTCEC